MQVRNSLPCHLAKGYSSSNTTTAIIIYGNCILRDAVWIPIEMAMCLPLCRGDLGCVI